ncbi:hypothetical protein MMC26_002170 [Xylographa opegraphella]|nr:hypothetical protein [Xylographa opegraphella]
MSVRVVARIRPLLKAELEKDTIVTAVTTNNESPELPTIVRIPNPKNENEDFSFHFNSVYDQDATQQDLFENEGMYHQFPISPTIKHLFNGLDVTIFAHGNTGCGKTHTMRGGKALADRGMIPRLLSGIYRRSRKIEKDSSGESTVQVNMSYFEIYNDRVFDLFEALENRTTSGLQLRDNGGKTVVVGLTERPCESLKEFEKLYDEANMNRSTSATKLNAHSSRSHAVLCVKLVITTGDQTRTSTASAIDLAGSEDNRRTDNGKERLVESASINKSLFVLAQCVEAISKKQARIPYRESKMTRILSLGQNNGVTIMILNLAPVRSYHLDTLSSLNFANRTKKIEVKEIENEPVFKGYPRSLHSTMGSSMQRQPLRPLATSTHNTISRPPDQPAKTGGKPGKTFSVYFDKSRPQQIIPAATARRSDIQMRSSPSKRPSDSHISNVGRPAKMSRRSPPTSERPQAAISKAAIEDIIEKKVTELLAARALDQSSIAPIPAISEEVQRRLDLLEQKIEGKDDDRAEGLTFLLMAKQHHVRREDSSALRMYELAKQYFPDNAKLESKIMNLQEKLRKRRDGEALSDGSIKAFSTTSAMASMPSQLPSVDKVKVDGSHDTDFIYHDEDDYQSDDGFRYKPKANKVRRIKVSPAIVSAIEDEAQTPRSRRLLEIINTRDIDQIRLLKGVGQKKAEAIVASLCSEDEGATAGRIVENLSQLGRLRGVGMKTVENMRFGLAGTFDDA